MSFLKRPFFYLIVSSTITGSVCAQTDSTTTQDILQQVKAHSTAIALEKQHVAAAKTMVKQATINQLPTLSVFGAVEKATNMPIYENGLNHAPVQHDVIHTLYSSGANFYLNLFDGLKMQHEKNLAKIDEEIAIVNAEKMQAAMQLKALHLFYDLYVQYQWKQTMLIDINEKEHELEEIKNFYQAGVILESDVLRAELELSKRRMTVVEIENSIKVFQQQLNMLIGKEDDHTIIPSVNSDFSQLENIPLDQAINYALHHAYDGEISHHHVAEKEVELRITKSNYSPKIGLTGSFQFSNPQIFLYPYNASWYTLGIAGIKLSYDINSLYHNRQKVKKAQIEIDAAHTHHELVNESIKTKVYQQYYALDEAKKRESIYQKNKQYADENARIIHNAYFSKTALITDLLDANVLQLKANFELEQAKTNILKTYYSLKYELGNI